MYAMKGKLMNEYCQRVDHTHILVIHTLPHPPPPLLSFYTVLSKSEMIKRNKVRRVLAEQEILVRLLCLAHYENSINLHVSDPPKGYIKTPLYCTIISQLPK